MREIRLQIVVYWGHELHTSRIGGVAVRLIDGGLARNREAWLGIEGAVIPYSSRGGSLLENVNLGEDLFSSQLSIKQRLALYPQ